MCVLPAKYNKTPIRDYQFCTFSLSVMKHLYNNNIYLYENKPCMHQPHKNAVYKKTLKLLMVIYSYKFTAWLLNMHYCTYTSCVWHG